MIQTMTSCYVAEHSVLSFVLAVFPNTLSQHGLICHILARVLAILLFLRQLNGSLDLLSVYELLLLYLNISFIIVHYIYFK